MKINAEKFIEQNKGVQLESNFFLISGNEEGLINEIEKIIIQKLKLKKFKEIHKTENIKIASINDLVDRNISLFGESKIYLHKNPKEIIFKNLDDVNPVDSAIIISSDKIKNNSKIKNFFDYHKSFYSISCYKISPQFKKKTIDNFLSLNQVKLEKDAYWFLLEYSENQYKLLINELNKLQLYNKAVLKIEEIRLLLSAHQNNEFEKLFFQIIMSNKVIIFNSRLTINSLSDSYLFIQKVKYFIDLLNRAGISFAENKDMANAEQYLPKYLFKEKDKFKLMIKKINISRIVAINHLIKKTEILLRKNNGIYLIIIQRFLLNLRKNLV